MAYYRSVLTGMNLPPECGFSSCFGPEEAFARAIEAKLKEKNE